MHDRRPHSTAFAMMICLLIILPSLSTVSVLFDSVKPEAIRIEETIQTEEVVPPANVLPDPEYHKDQAIESSEVNIEGERGGRKFLNVSKLNFDPWNPEDGENVECTANIHNFGTGDQIAYNVNVEFFSGDECIGTDIIDEIQPGANATASMDWRAVYGSHAMRVIADPDGSDGGPDEYEASLTVSQSDYSPELLCPNNASWIRNNDTNYYYINVTNHGKNIDTIDLSFQTIKYGMNNAGWTIQLDDDRVTLNSGEHSYVQLSVDYHQLMPDYTAEAVVQVTAQSQGDSSNKDTIHITTNVIHDTPILFVDDDGQHEFRGVNDPMLPGDFVIGSGTWGGSYGAESDHLMNYSLDANYEGLWDYVRLPGDNKIGRVANSSFMGNSGPVFNSLTIGYNPVNYPYEDGSGNDIFLENYDVVIWNLGYSESMTSHPNGSDEPRSSNDDWWDQNETAKYLKAGGSLWLTGNAISFYFDRYATIEGEVTNQWLREYFHVKECAHSVGLKPQIMGVTMDPIGNGIDTINGYYYGNKVVGGERGNVATDWTPMADAQGIIYGNGKHYSAVRYEHPYEGGMNQRFKTVLQSGGFENYGDWDVIDEPMRTTLVEKMITWLGVPPKIAPKYDVGILKLNQPLADYILPERDLPINITVQNNGQKDITGSFSVKCRIDEVGGNTRFQKTISVSDNIPVGDVLDVQIIWTANQPQDGKDYRITVTIVNPSFSDDNPGNNEVSVVKRSSIIRDVGIGKIWHDWEAPWNAAMIGHETTFHAKVLNYGSTEETFDVDAVIWSPLETIVFEGTASVTLFPGHSMTLNWTWTPRNPGGLISGVGGSEGDVSDPYIVNISVRLAGDEVVGNDGKDLEVVVMAFFDGSEPKFMLDDWTTVDLSDHDAHGNDDEETPWHLTNNWYMSPSNSWKASNSQGQLKADWDTCLISPKISLKNFTSAMINNMHSGQLGGSCFLELSIDYDGNPSHVESATWSQIWSKSYQSQAFWMVWGASNLGGHLEEEFYLRYRLITSEDNNIGWYADDLVITGVVKNYNTNDIGVSKVSIDHLIDTKEIPRNIDVTIKNFGENKTNTGDRPGFEVQLTIEDKSGEEVYFQNTTVNEVLGIGDSYVVSFNTANGKDWIPEENGVYKIIARTVWENDTISFDENPNNDVMVIDGVVQKSFFSDNMENGENQWETGGNGDGWELGTPTAGSSGGPTPHSGIGCWGTNLVGNYPDLDGGSITLEHRIDLRTAIDPVLSFWHWLEVEDQDHDTAYVEVRTTDQSDYAVLWTNPDSSREGVPFRTNGWEVITIDLEDFAYHEVFIRFRLETSADVNYRGWYIDDMGVGGSTPPSHDAMVLSIDYPSEDDFIPPAETIEIYVTVMNVGLNQEIIPVRCKAIRQGASPITFDLGTEYTTILNPGDEAQISFPWMLPAGTYRYSVEVRTELEDDGNPTNDEQEIYIWAKEIYDVSLISLYADPMIQDVARTREVTVEVMNVGNKFLDNNVDITFQALFDGETVDEYSTTIRLERNEIKPVTWEWQSFKYGSFSIHVEAEIRWESDDNLDDNVATLEGIKSVETIFSDTREKDNSPYYLDQQTGEFRIWDRTEMGGPFWTGDNESDPAKAGWHIEDQGHFSRRSWYGGIPNEGKYGNNKETSITSQALNLENYSDDDTNVGLSFYTNYVLEGSDYDYVDISISTDADNDESWERLLKFPDSNESYDSVMESGNRYGWLHKDVHIPDTYLNTTFHMRITLKTNNDITYSGVWIDDIILYSTTTDNHEPIARFEASIEEGNESYSRNVIRNPTSDILWIKGDSAYNNLPRPAGGKQPGILMGQEIDLSADLTFDPDPYDGDIAYRWDFGDGQIGYGKSVSHAYSGELPLEGYFMITLRVTDEYDAFSEDTMLVWIGNKAPEANFKVTSSFDNSTQINDENDGVENGIIDVFYGDSIIFHEQASDPENDDLTYQWEFQCESTNYKTHHVGKIVSGIVGVDFLFKGLDGTEPIIPVIDLDYEVTLVVSDEGSSSEITYIVVVHPYATHAFVKPVKIGYSILDATVVLTWRGFEEDAAPQVAHISPERPVFVHIDEDATSPDLNLHDKGGIGLVYDIRAVGCSLQNGEEGFIEAEIKIPILTNDLEEYGDSFLLQQDLRLERWNETDRRYEVVDGSKVEPDGGVKYVVGIVEGFSIYTAIIDSIYNPSNPNHDNLLPDLAVHKIEFSRSPVLVGQYFEVRAEIRNVGVTHAINADVDFYDGDDIIATETIKKVRAGGSGSIAKLLYKVSSIDPTATSETHYIKVIVNKQHRINEGPLNYKNNEKLQSLVTVSSKSQPPTPVISVLYDGTTQDGSGVDGKKVHGTVMIQIETQNADTAFGIVSLPFGNNDFAWYIEYVHSPPISVHAVNYTILDQDGAGVNGGEGGGAEIYGLNFEDSTTYISFQDNDRDGNISEGDVFLVKNILNGGLAGEGYSLELGFEEVNKAEISIDDGKWITLSGADIWRYEWETKEVENGEHTIKARSYDGQEYSEETSIIIHVKNEGDDQELLISLLLIIIFGMLSLILIAVVTATFDIKL